MRISMSSKHQMTSIRRLSSLTMSIFVLICSIQSCKLDGRDQEYVDRCHKDLHSIVQFIEQLGDAELHPLGSKRKAVAETEFTAEDFFEKLGVSYYRSLRDQKGEPYRILVREGVSIAWSNGLNARNEHGRNDDIVVPFNLPAIDGWIEKE